MTTPEKGEKVYEGKAKILYATDDEDLLILHFKDDATAFNAKKRGTWERKGLVNCRISTILTKEVERYGVKTHLCRQLGDVDQLVRRVQIVPVEVVVRNVVAGSLARRLGMEEGRELSRPFVEYYYKSDELDDPMILRSWAIEFGWATEEELARMDEVALIVDQVVSAFWDRLGVRLIDFKIEFGRSCDGELLLADEITPDGSRLWEKGTNRKLDKDRFRHDLGDVSGSYEELLAMAERA